MTGMADALEAEEQFARMVVDQGLARPEHVRECMEEVRRSGGATRLGDLLRQKGYLGGAASGDRVGGYVKERKLGEGGMGEVWRAQDTKLNRWVALKFIKGRDEGERARFRREAQTAARLVHPHIAAIYEAGEDYIAMQLVEGQTLATYPRHDPRVLAGIVRDAALAVHFANEQGIVHRDLKPANLMVTDSGARTPATRPASPSGAPSIPHVYVMDFGLAKPTDAKSSLSASGALLGTPSYMSPEQAMGRSDIDRRADVYSLGATLYELLSGRPPFSGESLIEVLAAVASDEPRPVRLLNPRVPADLETIVLKCLEKDRAARYATAAALAEDLDRYLAGEPIQARPLPAAARAWRRVVKHRAIVLPTAAALLLGAGFGTWQLLRASQAERTLDQAGHASAVLRRWWSLDGPLREIERHAYDDGLDGAERARRIAEPWAAVEAFRRATPGDAASQATMKALVGSATALARQGPEGLELIREAQRMEPDLPYGHLMEAFCRFAWYINTVRQVDMEGREDGETPEMQEQRRGVEQLIERARRAKFWGPEGAASFSAAMDSLRAIQQGRPADAEEALGRAMRAPEMRALEGSFTLARARVRVRLGKYDDALRDFDTVLALRPGQRHVHLHRGDCLLQAGRFDQAIEAYGRDLDASHVCGPALVNCGVAYALRGQAEAAGAGDPRGSYEKAVALFDRALEHTPRDASALDNRGAARTTLADAAALRGADPRPMYEAAIGDFDAAMEARAARPGTLTHRGIAHRRLAEAQAARGIDPRPQVERALADFDAALALQPGAADALAGRGMARLSLAELDEALGRDPRPSLDRAIGDLEAAAAGEPRRVESRVHLALAHTHRGDSEGARGGDPRASYDSAIAACTEALALNADWLAAYNTRGSAYLARAEREPDPGDTLRLAVEDFSQAIRRNREYGKAYNNRGRAWSALAERQTADPAKFTDLMQKAVDDFTEALRLNPESISAYINRGSAFLSAGHVAAGRGQDPQVMYGQAVADFDEVLKRNPGDARALNNRANAHSAMGDALKGDAARAAHEKGLADYDAGLAQSPGLWQLHSNRGNLLGKLGRWREAAAAYERALSLNPKAPGVRALLDDARKR